MSAEVKPPSSGATPRRIGIVAGIVLILAVAAAAVFTSLSPPEDLDPATAEGVIQAFFRAIDGRDFEAAHALLGPDITDDCTPADLATSPSEYDRAVIDRVVTSGTRTVVWVSVRRIDVSDPLNPYTYDEVMEFQVDTAGATPVISRLPWQFYCGGKL